MGFSAEVVYTTLTHTAIAYSLPVPPPFSSATLNSQKTPYGFVAIFAQGGMQGQLPLSGWGLTLQRHFLSSILTAFVAINPLISNSYKALYFNGLRANEGKSNTCVNIVA